MSHLAPILCLLAAALAAQEPPAGGEGEASARVRPPTRFVALTRNEFGEPTSLQTATVRYRSADGDLLVDLIGVVHIGDPGYYRELNESFEQYDALLYELVAPPGHEVPRRDVDEGGLATLLQGAGAAYLGLTSQLEQVDYTPENFVHADLSPREMAEALERRGENGFTLALGVLADMLRQTNLESPGQPPGTALDRELAELDPLDLLFDPEGASKLKRFLAVELSRQTGSEELGRTLDALLIQDRNRAAMNVLTREVARGRKRIGLFYGAAHMPDFERRLVMELGLRREGVRWTRAWDLNAPASPSSSGADTLFRMMGDLLEAGTR